MSLYVIKKDKLALIAGKIVEISDGKGKAEGRVVNLGIIGGVWDKAIKKETVTRLTVSFWNSDNGQKMLADRIKKCNVKIGGFISVLVSLKNDGMSASALNFKFGGCWHFPEQNNEREINVIIGPVASVKEDSDNRFVKIDIPDNAKEGVEWRKITFWNGERKTADGARLYLSQEQNRKKVIVVCGPDTHYNGAHTYTGYGFEIIK